MLRTEDLEDQGQLLANVFNLKLLENQEERPVSYMLKTASMWVSEAESLSSYECKKYTQEAYMITVPFDYAFGTKN